MIQAYIILYACLKPLKIQNALQLLVGVKRVATDSQTSGRIQEVDPLRGFLYSTLYSS